MNTWYRSSVAILLFLSAGLANGQDLNRLESEVQNQIQVTQDLSHLVNRTIVQDQAEAVLKHHDYWLKKRALVARVSAGLAEYEAYLATHMDPLKPLYARHNFIANSDQYTADQKNILIEDLMKGLFEIVEKKIQPEKKRAYIKLLSAISHYLPIVDKTATIQRKYNDAKTVIDSFFRAGSPEKVIEEYGAPKAIMHLALLEIAPGCYSKTCIMLYQADIVRLTLDIFERIPSHVIINIGDHSDDKKFALGITTEGSKAPIPYKKHVIPTYQFIKEHGQKASIYSNFDELHKDLPYGLSEEDYAKNKLALEETLNSNLKRVDQDLNRSLTSEAIFATAKPRRNDCGSPVIVEKLISDAIISMCKFSTVPGGEFCLNTPENIAQFAKENTDVISKMNYCSYHLYGVGIGDMHTRTMRVVYKMKWPK
jgi:hypothetical protein